MPETPPPIINQNPTVVSVDPKNGSKRKIWLGIVGILLLIVAGGLIYWQQTKKSPIEAILPPTPPKQTKPTLDQVLRDKGVFAQDARVIKVGGEVVYGRDLNYILYNLYPESFESSGDQLTSFKEKAITQAIDDSVVLQAGAKLKYITLSPIFYGAVEKNLPLRATMVRQVQDKLSDAEKKYSGEAISVWFYNVKAPKIGVEEAKKKALGVMSGLRERLVSGKISMLQAGEELKNMTELANQDPSYKGNAYRAFDNATIDNPPFSFDEQNKVFFALAPNKLSDLILVSSTASGTPREEFYSLIKMGGSVGTQTSFENWLIAERKKYEVTRI